jgi:hypothetical protein
MKGNTTEGLPDINLVVARAESKKQIQRLSRQVPCGSAGGAGSTTPAFDGGRVTLPNLIDAGASIDGGSFLASLDWPKS